MVFIFVLPILITTVIIITIISISFTKQHDYHHDHRKVIMCIYRERCIYLYVYTDRQTDRQTGRRAVVQIIN